MRSVEPRTPAEITEVARGIVTGDLMVADLDDQDWQASLALIIALWEEIPDGIGLIVVPKGPHLSGLWLNGHVPGVTTQCGLVALSDMPALRAEVARMNAALYPEKTTTKDEGL